MCLGESHGLGRQRAVCGCGERGSHVGGTHRTGHRWQVVGSDSPSRTRRNRWTAGGIRGGGRRQVRTEDCSAVATERSKTMATPICPVHCGSGDTICCWALGMGERFLGDGRVGQRGAANTADGDNCVDCNQLRVRVLPCARGQLTSAGAVQSEPVSAPRNTLTDRRQGRRTRPRICRQHHAGLSTDCRIARMTSVRRDNPPCFGKFRHPWPRPNRDRSKRRL